MGSEDILRSQEATGIAVQTTESAGQVKYKCSDGSHVGLSAIYRAQGPSHALRVVQGGDGRRLIRAFRLQ